MGRIRSCFMGFIKDFKALIKPVFGAMSFLVFITFIFIPSYVFFEYQKYLSTYQKNQQEEVKLIQHKIKAFLGKIQELRDLTSYRIIATEGDTKQIQNILISAPRLYDPVEIPRIQKLSYYKSLEPTKLITRYETSPLEPKSLSILQTSGNKTSSAFSQNFFLSKTPVFNSKGKLEGVLEIQIALPEFKASLGILEFISFDPLFLSSGEKAQLLQKEPFAIYPKSPRDLWQFIVLSKDRYGIFLFYFILCVVCFMLSMLYFRRDRQKAYGAEIENLNANIEKLNADLMNSKTTEEEARKNFCVSEEKRKNHNTTYNSYKKIHFDLSLYQQGQVHHIANCLNILKKDVKEQSAELLPEHQLKLLRSCLLSTNRLANGLVSKTKNELIEVETLLEETKSLFAERIYASQINLEIICQKDLNFLGDRFFIQFIVVNLLGRAVYRVPKNGIVTLTARRQNEGILFEVRDEGFVIVNSSERLIKKAFDFLLGEEDFHKVCIQNGLQYQYVRDEEDFNHAAIFIPSSSGKEEQDNVVELFNKEIELL